MTPRKRPRNVRARRHRGQLPLHPAQLERILVEERTARRQERLRQVRIQARDHAQRVRVRVEAERQRAQDRVAQAELVRYRATQVAELATLEAEYEQCLREIGVGHQGVEAEEEFRRFQAEQRAIEVAEAERRGREAGRRERRKRELSEKRARGRSELRQAALMAEKGRSAQLRARLPTLSSKEPLELVEIVPDENRVRSRLVPRRALIQDPPLLSSKEQVVRRVPLGEVALNGLEAAIWAQEEERRERAPRVDQAKSSQAQERGHAALMKELRAKDRQVMQLINSPQPVAPQRGSLSTILEESTDSRPSGRDPSDLDWVPVRGPSTESSENLSSSGTSGSSAVALVERPSKTVTFGGPTSAFAIPRPAGSQWRPNDSDLEFEQLRHILRRVQEQRQDLMVVDGRGHGTKSEDPSAQGFVAKVLGIPVARLQGEDKIEFQFRVREFSASTTTSFHQDSGASHSNSSSTDITKERFISGPLLPGPVSNSREVLHDDSTMIHSLIDVLKGSASSTGKSRQNHLRYYIEKLLNMKREEIHDLSVSDVSSSIQSSTSSSSSSTVMASSKESFVASTPASILSHSDPKSSSSGSSPKTVRFQDDLDGTYARLRQRRSDSDLLESHQKKVIQHQKAEIQFKTRVSLDELQRSFEEQKQLLERKLELRRQKRSPQSSSSSSASEDAQTKADAASDRPVSQGQTMPQVDLSEGPLSSSSGSHRSTHEDTRSTSASSTSALSVSTNSTKESSITSRSSLGSNLSPPDIDQMLKNLKLNWAHSMMRRMREQAAITQNKSSSSGSSGSAALADIRSKLASIEVPQLRPPASKSSEDTLAQLPEIVSDVPSSVRAGQDLKNVLEAAVISSFHLSSEGDKLELSDSISHISLSSGGSESHVTATLVQE